MGLRRRRGGGGPTVVMPGGPNPPKKQEHTLKIPGWAYFLITASVCLAGFYIGSSTLTWIDELLNGLANRQLQSEITHNASNLDKVTTATRNINEQYGEAGYIFDPCTSKGDPPASETFPVSCHL